MNEYKMALWEMLPLKQLYFLFKYTFDKDLFHKIISVLMESGYQFIVFKMFSLRTVVLLE